MNTAPDLTSFVNSEICDSSCYERHEWNKDLFHKALGRVPSGGTNPEDIIMKQVHRVIDVLYRQSGQPCEPKALLEKVCVCWNSLNGNK